MSHEAAVAAAALGYTNLMIYQAGIPDWLMRGYRVASGSSDGRN